MHPVRKLFKSRPAPRPVIAHLINFPAQEEEPEFWTLRVYRDNFDSFGPESKLIIHNWISDVIKTIRIIEPNMYLEVYEKAPGGNNGS